MLEFAICDDNVTELNKLKNMIIRSCRENNIQATISLFPNGVDLLNGYQKFDAIFLDIKMDQLDGIQTALEIRKQDKHVKIIYVTNYSSFQSDAFTVRAFGYVVKPISYEQIYKQLKDIIEYSSQESALPTYTFNTDKGFKTIKLQDIYYFESYNHKVKIQCKEKVYFISDSIINIFNLFKADGFSMPHKSYIVNLMHVSNIKGYDLELINGMVIPISQKRAVEFKRNFHTYLRNNFNVIIRS